MAKKVGSATVFLTGDIAGLVRSLQSAKKELTAAAGEIAMGVVGLAKKIAEGVAVAGLGLTAFVTGATWRFMAVGDEIGVFAERLGISARALSELKFVAERADVSFAELVNALKAQNRNLSEAAEKGGEVQTILQRMGLDAERLKNLKPDEAFWKMVAGLAGIKNQAERTEIAMKLWGKSGDTIINVAEMGADKIDGLRRKAVELGAVMSDIAVRDAGGLVDALKNLKYAADGILLAVGEAAAPAFQRFMEILTRTAVTVREWVNQHFESLYLLSNSIGELGSTVERLAVPVLNWLLEIATKVVGGIQRAFAWLVTSLGEQEGSVAAWIDRMMVQLEVWALQLQLWAMQAWNGMRKAWSDAFDASQGSIIIGMALFLKNLAVRLAPVVFEAGQNIGRGIISGIRQAVEWGIEDLKVSFAVDAYELWRSATSSLSDLNPAAQYGGPSFGARSEKMRGSGGGGGAAGGAPVTINVNGAGDADIVAEKVYAKVLDARRLGVTRGQLMAY